MTPPPSLERRLIAGLAAFYMLAIVAVIAGYLVVSWATHHIEIVDMTNDLADDLAQSLQRSASGEVMIAPDSDVAQEVKRIPDIAYAIDDTSSGKRLLAAGVIPRGIELPDRGWEFGGRYTSTDGTRRFVAISNAVSPIGPVHVVLVRGGITDKDLWPWVCDELSEEILPVVVPIFLISMLVVWMTARRTLLPLRVVSAKASQIGTGEQSSGRLTEEGVPGRSCP